MTEQQKYALVHWFRFVATIIGTMVIVGGAVGGAFAAYYGLERKEHAEEKRQAIWQAVAKKEDKDKAKEAYEAIHESISQFSQQQQRVNEQMLKNDEVLRNRTWELLQDSR